MIIKKFRLRKIFYLQILLALLFTCVECGAQQIMVRKNKAYYKIYSRTLGDSVAIPKDTNEINVWNTYIPLSIEVDINDYSRVLYGIGDSLDACFQKVAYDEAIILGEAEDWKLHVCDNIMLGLNQQQFKPFSFRFKQGYLKVQANYYNSSEDRYATDDALGWQGSLCTDFVDVLLDSSVFRPIQLNASDKSYTLLKSKLFVKQNCFEYFIDTTHTFTSLESEPFDTLNKAFFSNSFILKNATIVTKVKNVKKIIYLSNGSNDLNGAQGIHIGDADVLMQGKKQFEHLKDFYITFSGEIISKNKTRFVNPHGKTYKH